MEEVRLNVGGPRAIKARYALVFGKKSLQLTLLGISLTTAVLGIFTLFQKNELGFLILIPAVVCLMFRWWYKGELESLVLINSQDPNVDDVLDQSILARIKNSNPSAYEIWQAASATNERWFFQNRFMLHESIFEEMLDKNPGSSSLVWKHAAELQVKYKTNGYTASIVIVSLLKSIPNIEESLHRAKMELKDVELGIEWVEDINAKRKLAKEKKYFGGIGRDWAYGYTPTLQFLGENISQQIQYGGFFAGTEVHDQVVAQMMKSMGSGTGSITLVGEIGVGKTTTVFAFAQKILEDSSTPSNIRYNQVVALDAPTILASASRPGEIERLLLRILDEARRAKNIILFFDDAQVFFGQGPTSVDLSNILTPAIESGSVRLIFSMTPKEWQNIGAVNSTLASKLQPLQVRPANEEETIHVLKDEVLLIEARKGVLYTQQALREAYKLGSRYVDNQAMPGAALKVLDSAASVAPDGYVTAEIVQQSIESSLGVKVQGAKGEETGALLNLEDELHKYVINQKQAVSVIANALRRSRSGVGNPERPVGTFLFLGPTGVGKTELSKALARVYFGDEKSMIRVDMNQFVSPEDVNRLISPMLGEQLGFLGQVRRQPFSVILLDEIEKAHRNVVNLLLQTLDEGVMKDVDNKPVSFKDAIIIATSNAGADEIRRLIDEGQDISKLQSKLVDIVIERNIFAPEFVNRFDEVVVFRPLNQEELIQVIDLIIAGVNKTMDAQKVQVELTDQAKIWLVQEGYDPKLGARPMRRVVQRYVENILAKRLLEQSASSGSTIRLDVNDFTEIAGD